MNNENYRIAAVNRFKNPDAAVTNDLNEIVKLTAQICDAPVALITLLDEDTQWFKAGIGFDLDCSPRDVSFCNYTIKQTDVIIVPDTLADDRFTDNPLVTGAPFVRFYAGATLTTKDGYAIGTLCIIDFKPRTLNEEQENLLRVLGKQTMNLMELNWSLQQVEKQQKNAQKQSALIAASELKLNAIFNSSRHTHILVNKSLKVIAFNRASALFVQHAYGKTIKIGSSVLEYADQEAVEGFANLFKGAFADKTIKMEWNMRPGTEYDSWKEMEFMPIKDDNGKIIGVALNAIDITERKLQQDHINIQNAALTRIAIMQSHGIRRPVASLIGIMALIKMEQDNAANYVDILEQTINDLDERIREIVADSEDTLNTNSNLAIVA
jgi:PAS domain S-box-containing protein